MYRRQKLNYRGDRILSGFDEGASGLIAESMRERGSDLHIGTNIVEMDCAGSDDSDTGMGGPIQDTGETVGDSGLSHLLSLIHIPEPTRPS